MDSEGVKGTTVDVDETNEMVLVIVVVTDDMVMGGVITITEVEVVLVTPLLVVCGNVTGITE